LHGEQAGQDPDGRWPADRARNTDDDTVRGLCLAVGVSMMQVTLVVALGR
jgi:hypothetical protein